MIKPTRRRFILAAGAGLGATAFAASQLRSKGLQEFAQKSRAFGTNVSIVVYHDDHRVAGAALNAAFSELELVETLMSIYRPDSQLSRLNTHGKLSGPHPYFVEVLQTSQGLSRTTSGAFDITVQPLWKTFASAQKRGDLPAANEVRKSRELVDWKSVNITANHVSFAQPGMAITLNGIAQGFATDVALKALRSHGIEHALVDTGEIGSSGSKAADKPWVVGIQHPRVADAYIDLARLDGRCMATSGDYATTFTPDRRLNHIFDPKTGNSPDSFASVTVLAKSGIEADGLSTSVFVMGPERGFDLIEAWPEADAFAVLKDGRTLTTSTYPGKHS